MAHSGADESGRAARIDLLVQQIAAISDPATRAQVEELVRALLELYGDGLARMLELAAASEPGDRLIEAFANDEFVGALLLLHGLHPLDVETRVRRAVEDARTSIERHGGSVELIGVGDGVARVRLRAGGPSCSASARQLQDMLEEAIYATAPELDEVRVEGVAPASRLITLSRAPRRASAEAGASRQVG